MEFFTINTSLITDCIQGCRKSQKKLYDILSPKMYAVCLKFYPNSSEAEDILQEGFIKLFNNLKNFRGEGSFEGWARRIFVNTAIQHFRNQKPLSVCASEYENILSCRSANGLQNLYVKDIINIANDLSTGYRIVFRLYAIEGYSHKEISEMLGIQESTSKSQYLRAKASIRQRIGKRA